MIVKYEVNYWEELEHDHITESGLVSGVDEAECMENIFKYYGRTNVGRFTIEYLLDEDCDCIIPKKDIFEAFENESNT